MTDALRTRLEGARDGFRPEAGSVQRFEARRDGRRRRQVRIWVLAALFGFFVMWGSIASPTATLAATESNRQLAAMRNADVAPARADLVASVAITDVGVPAAVVILLIVLLVGGLALVVAVRPVSSSANRDDARQ